MATWPVFVEAWQFECCGERFAVGDRVAWALVLHDNDFGLGFAVSEVAGRTARLAADDGEEGIAVSAGGLIAWRRGAGTDGGRLRGLLVEDHHGEAPLALADTHGVVRRMQLVSERAAGPPVLRDVARLPAHFATWEAGVLVNLEVRRGAAGQRRA